MRVSLMISSIPGSTDVLVSFGIWVSPCHFGGGGSNPNYAILFEWGCSSTAEQLLATQEISVQIRSAPYPLVAILLAII